ncbi:MAG: hypothetical protein U0T82_02970 [Bacteroidales bacterium]
MVSNIARNKVRLPEMSTDERYVTLFVPRDEVMQNYLDNTVLILLLPRQCTQITLYYILQTWISRSLALISKIERQFFNSFGDPMVISRDVIDDAHVQQRVDIRNQYGTGTQRVYLRTGKLFFDKNYSTLLFTINAANLTASLAVPSESYPVAQTMMKWKHISSL